jgi:hypothetical protein
MATAEESESKLPEKIGVNVTRAEDIEQFREIRQHIADKRDCSVDDVARTDVLRALMQQYQFQRLEQDARVQEAKEHVAQDHNVDPEDISLACLLKHACAAYNGWQQTNDWLDA